MRSAIHQWWTAFSPEPTQLDGLAYWPVWKASGLPSIVQFQAIQASGPVAPRIPKPNVWPSVRCQLRRSESRRSPRRMPCLNSAQYATTPVSVTANVHPSYLVSAHASMLAPPPSR